jgi:hypothetical protein
MEPAGWVLVIVVTTQVVCHVANTFIREYFSRLDRLRAFLSERASHPAEGPQKPTDRKEN